MKRDKIINRRSFIKTVSVTSGVFFFQPLVLGSNESRTILQFGLIADVHQDIMHDSPQRIRAFTKAMKKSKADFVCQLGDFCQPRERNREFIAQWNQFKRPHYHVIGNHEMDGGFTREQVVSYLDMPARHYSFDKKGVHFIVLDGNDPGGESEGYNRYIGEKQLSWIEKNLSNTSLPTIVFSHQTLDGTPGGIENSDDVRKILEDARTGSGQKKVVACFCGHHHIDQAKEINGIHYIHINSASYAWLGGQFKHESYNADIHQKFPWISYTAPYKEPLWAFVEMDLAKGRLIVKGKATSWVGPTPWELGVDKKTKDPNVCAPRISDRTLSI